MSKYKKIKQDVGLVRVRVDSRTEIMCKPEDAAIAVARFNEKIEFSKKKLIRTGNMPKSGRV